jgi:predicted acyl esterase
MSTTEKLKSRFPDLNFVNPIQVENHPRYKPFDVKFRPEHVLLPKGHVKEDGRKKMLVDSVLDRDTKIALRDGLHVYADIFRPASSDETKVPAVICWSPYGKSSISIDNIWHRSGVPKDWTSGYETFEGLDPADWCRRGYAVVNVDARGCQFSEGTYFFWGEQEAEDIYDTIDFLSKQPWCNGSICMGGNSYLAKAQVNFASKQSHPALKALAPWEGFTDIYRQLLRRGGFAMNNTFATRYQWSVAGKHEVEDMAKMVKTHPLFDDYWADKYDEVANIDVPLYVLGSFNNPFHVQGSFDTFRRARSTKKWMRVHSSFEWYEMYEPNSNNDLQRFFDRYCKGIMNGWESDTPPLRLSIYGVGSIPNVVERPEAEFPLARQRLETFYLDAATKLLHDSPRDSESSISHESHGLDAPSSVRSATSATEIFVLFTWLTWTHHHQQDFILKFSEYTEVVGYAKLRLWMSCKEKDDMDVVVQLRKVDSKGNLLVGLNFPSPVPESEAPEGETAKTYGPQGFLRASSAASRDEARSSLDGQEVFYRHDREEKIAPGTVVPLDITLWPMGMAFAAGEGIMVRVAGHFLSEPSVEAMRPQASDDENLGQHHIHTGGKYDSSLILPVVGVNRA